jgi:cytochrome c oxidase assembly protein subunit 15
LVILQGVLGGARVLFDERMIALIHGCVGPLFFAYLAGLVVVTSRWWQTAKPAESAIGSRLARAAWATVGIAFVQLVLGAVVRHVPLTAMPGVFRAALVLHLIVAGLLAMHVLARPWLVWKLPAEARGAGWPIVAVQALVVAQIALGIGTYVVKYSWPAWLGDFQFAAAYRVQAESLGQAMMVTAHVANGSLILFLAVLAAMRTTRLYSTNVVAARQIPASFGRAAT